ncbi:MAG TPA: hypothetical protein VJO99_07055 [Burkholderiaceae bacterium]|nr:hypothetical protein [Burkholderiaceae bacterium]
MNEPGRLLFYERWNAWPKPSMPETEELFEAELCLAFYCGAIALWKLAELIDAEEREDVANEAMTAVRHELYDFVALINARASKPS